MKIGYCGIIGVVGVVCACGGNPSAGSEPNISRDTPVGPSFEEGHTLPASPCDGITVPAVADDYRRTTPQPRCGTGKRRGHYAALAARLRLRLTISSALSPGSARARLPR